MSNWKIGDKAVCIARGWPEKVFDTTKPPEFGVTYLVTNVVNGTLTTGSPAVGLKLANCETWRTKKVLFVFTKHDFEGWFNSECFRKVVTATEQAALEMEARK